MISVGFSTTRSLWSRLIRAVTRAPVSHAWLLLDDTFCGERLVLGADEEGMRLVPYGLFQSGHDIVAVIEPPFSIDAGVRALVPKIGDRYDWRGALAAGIVALARRGARRARSPFYSARALFCSEAVAIALRAAMVPGAAELDPPSTTPADLLAFMKGL
jgi:hypothetical protein